MTEFHDDLKTKADSFAHLVYKITRQFPKEEMYGVTSQLRRAALSVILNYVEGYARRRNKVYKNFLEMAYGSLKESKYLLHFSYKENFISEDDYKITAKLADDLGAMLWSTISKVEL